MVNRKTFTLLASLWVGVCTGVATAGNWPRFRGPEGTGHSSETGVPVSWKLEDVVWRTPLPGLGQSSPIVWENRIYLTAALDGGKERVVLAVDRQSGKILWQRTFKTGDPGPTHSMNPHASSTCVTDGERVYSFFGNGGFHAHDIEGNHLWSRTDLGEFLSIWSTAASPILHKDLAIVCCDQDAVLEKEQHVELPSKAYILAVDKRTGKTVWKTTRFGSRGWSTPVPLTTPMGTVELVVNGPGGVFAYDADTGKLRWQCDRETLFGEPTVAYDENTIYAVSGRPGPLLAIRRGGEGNVTNTHLPWSIPRRTRDLSSPILADGLLYTAAMNGIGICYDPATGSEIWKERMGGEFTASPVAAGGLLYFLNRKGETVVLKPGKSLDIVSRNPLPTGPDEEDFLASPALSEGQFFFRSDRAIYAVGERKTSRD
ncbi:MAG: PQQ-binding-like beta-propeller repeat protein [Planctomycetota bacterium]